MNTFSEREMERSARRVWLMILAVHAAACVGALAALPGGFPPSHAHFWTNRIVPAVGILLCLVVLIAGYRKQRNWTAAMLLIFPLMWGIGGAAAWMTFPISGRRIVIPLWIGTAIMAYAWRMMNREVRLGWDLRLAAFVVSASIGIAIPIMERGPEALTKPMDEAIYRPPMLPAVVNSRPAKLSDQTRVTIASGDINIGIGRYQLMIEPLLTFGDYSPDRCWTVFAPKSIRIPPTRVVKSRSDQEGGITLGFDPSGGSANTLLETLEVSHTGKDQPIEILARRELKEDTYSHLNTFSTIFVSGHKRLFVEFSSCPNQRIEVLPADYPVGRPRRSAHLYPDQRLRVIEASSGEKGPFQTLAIGDARQELTMTLFDGEIEIARITLHDWIPQADTQLSPTAGWGVPVNAIEFALEGESANATGVFYISLANTSVGRGWDSVGHRAGPYRNRITITSPQVTSKE